MSKEKTTTTKAKAKTEETVAAAAVSIADLLSELSPEERAEVLALTGQDSQFSRVPTLKINYCDVADIHGNTIRKGNYVFNQSAATKEVTVVEDGEEVTEERMEDLGVDLGRSPSITVLAYWQQYTFYSNDAKQRCASQLFRGAEVPVGFNLKHECRSGNCPRRGKDVGKDDKCSCQFVVHCLVDIDGKPERAVMYVKGVGFIPFQDYLNTTGGIPLPYTATKLRNKQEKQGSITYFVPSFELDKTSLYPPEQRATNKQLALETVTAVDTQKNAAEQKQAARQLVGPSEGQKAIDVTQIQDDAEDIVFD